MERSEKKKINWRRNHQFKKTLFIYNKNGWQRI